MTSFEAFSIKNTLLFSISPGLPLYVATTELLLQDAGCPQVSVNDPIHDTTWNSQLLKHSLFFTASNDV